MPIDQCVKEKAYKLDPFCWRSYGGRGRAFKRAMETRRIASLARAAQILRQYATLPPWSQSRRYFSVDDAPEQRLFAYYHSAHDHVDFVISGGFGPGHSIWMVPGTYDADADAPPPPPPPIHTMLGHPFDKENWRIKLDDQFYSAGELREIAQIMDDVRDGPA
jgi:hypothetical protein